MGDKMFGDPRPIEPMGYAFLDTYGDKIKGTRKWVDYGVPGKTEWWHGWCTIVGMRLSCMKCGSYIAVYYPCGLCNKCFYAFRFVDPAQILSKREFTNRYSMYVDLTNQGMHKLAAKVIEDWVNGINDS